jgi:hypothetical protein
MYGAWSFAQEAAAFSPAPQIIVWFSLLDQGKLVDSKNLI